MLALFRGEQIRVLLRIFKQLPFGLMTGSNVKRLEDLKGLPNFKAEQFVDGRFYKNALPSLAREPGAKS